MKSIENDLQLYPFPEQSTASKVTTVLYEASLSKFAVERSKRADKATQKRHAKTRPRLKLSGFITHDRQNRHTSPPSTKATEYNSGTIE